MAQLNITLNEETLKELMLGDNEGAIRTLLESVFDAILKAEASEQIGAESYERSDERRTYRNGYRTRDLTTRVGPLILHVPKLRDGTFSTKLFSRYERSEQALQLALMEMVLQGVSTRKVQEVTDTLCGKRFSKSTVSALCGQLDGPVQAFKERPLSRNYPFVILDALYMKARERGAIRSKGMLIAIGINDEGHREVLGFEVGDGESYETWSRFIIGLKRRGLRQVDYVVSDEHSGLVQAIREQFNQVIWQRCQVHFRRNILGVTPKNQRKALNQALTDLFNSPTLPEAYKRKAGLLAAYSEACPKAMETLDRGFDDATAVYALPSDYRKRLRTSNLIERTNEEIRRRERVIRIFPNGASMTRLIGSLLIECHEKWQSGRAYLNLTDYKIEGKEIKAEAEQSRRELSEGVGA